MTFWKFCTPFKIDIPFCLCDLKVLAFFFYVYFKKLNLSNGKFFIMTLIIILGCNFLKDCLVEFQSQMELNLQVQLQMGCNTHFV